MIQSLMFSLLRFQLDTQEANRHFQTIVQQCFANINTNMSERSSKLLQDLVVYGNTGKHDALIRVGQAVVQGQKFGTVHISLALKVQKHIWKLLKDTRTVGLYMWAWHCLRSLCDPNLNTLAEGFMVEMQNTNILEHLASCYLSTTEADQASRVLFLYWFTEGSDIRCCQVWLQDGLFKALLQVIEAWQPRPQQLGCSVVANTLQIFKRLFACSHPPDQFLQSNTREVLDGLLCKLIAVRDNWQETGYSAIVKAYMFACTASYHLIYVNQRAALEMGNCEKLLFYTQEQAVRSMQQWYYVVRHMCSTRKSASSNSVSYHALAAMGFCDNILSTRSREELDANALEDSAAGYNVRHFDHIRHILLNSGDPTDPLEDHPTFMQLVLQAAREAGSAEHKYVDVVFGYVRQFPPLKAVVEEHVGKFEFCAHPDCPVTNYLPGRLKKCVRCRGAWYCSREHQVAHWPDHKKSCQKCGTTVAVEADADRQVS